MTDRLTHAELTAIRQRSEKATAGPWLKTFRCGIAIDSESVTGLMGEIVSEENGVTKYTDAEFIAHARTDVPRLLDDIDRLNGQLSELICAIYEHIPEGHELMTLAEEVDADD